MWRILETICHMQQFWSHSRFLSEKKAIFSQKNPNFESFENSYYSSRILRKICYNLVKRKFHVRKRERTSF